MKVLSMNYEQAVKYIKSLVKNSKKKKNGTKKISKS